MENTIENALDFAMEAVNGYDAGKPESISFDDVVDMLVAYASQTTPKLVLPEIQERVFRDEYEEGFNACLFQIHRLNPHLITE